MPEPRVARKPQGALALGVVLLTACGEPPPAPVTSAPKLVATSADFAPFRTWERIPLESPTLPVQALPGPAFTYINHRAPDGSRRYPVGTILVKTVEPSSDPRDWTVHAMVKRSERFNPEGSVGWEFFGLQLDEAGVPTILWRSEGYNDGHAYGSSTMALPPDRELSCNDCHALHWQDDAVLTPSLSLD